MRQAFGAVVLAAWLVVSGLPATGGLVACVHAQAVHAQQDQSVQGFDHPESVAYDPVAKVLYVSRFGPELRPTLKDGKGAISKVSLAGSILEDRFLPAGDAILHKPKGLWVWGQRLWVTDIDTVWIFDLKSRRGKRAVLPGAAFANDVTVMNGALFVSDTEKRRIYRITPADFLESEKAPTVTVAWDHLGFSPNGLYPSAQDVLVAVGYGTGNREEGIYRLCAEGRVTALADGLGRLDGLAPLGDKIWLVTDWKSGSLATWDSGLRIRPLARGFQGPADFCVVSSNKGLTAVVPDLVTGQLRMIRLIR
ncbi:MAG: hypothetical protein JRI36_09035 [Deltaproteobacteria bacterium]|nr:hypothetical protein [Deltaproteobacteria bacterium]